MDAIFFPRNDYPSNIEVCNHRFGKSMTYTEQTDCFKTNSFSIVMALAEQYNIKVGGFTNRVWDEVSDTDVLSYINNGLLWTDLYWRFSGMNDQTVVDETTYINKNAEQVEDFISRWNRKPITFSYGSGNYTFASYVGNKYLGGRTSLYNGDTDYGKSFSGAYIGTPSNDYSLQRFTQKASSLRFYDYADRSVGLETAISYLSDLIDVTYLNHGWVNNFHHWHNFITDNRESWLNSYFALLAQKKREYNDDIYFCGYGEAVAYLVYRSLISKAVMYSPTMNANTLIIRLEAKNSFSLDGINTTPIDADLLQIPINIKFSTVGTPLAGQTIRSNNNLISLGNNQYIVEIPYAEYPGAVIEKVIT